MCTRKRNQGLIRPSSTGDVCPTRYGFLTLSRTKVFEQPLLLRVASSYLVAAADRQVSHRVSEVAHGRAGPLPGATFPELAHAVPTDALLSDEVNGVQISTGQPEALSVGILSGRLERREDESVYAARRSWHLASR